MNKTEKFINSLNRYELSYLYKYKLETFMQDTQKYILGVMENENISIEDVDNLIEESKLQTPSSEVYCKRCKSTKLFYFETEFDNMSTNIAKWEDDSWTGKMKMVENKECAVCGYNEERLKHTNSENWKKYVTIGMVILFLIYVVYQIII